MCVLKYITPIIILFIFSCADKNISNNSAVVKVNLGVDFEKKVTLTRLIDSEIICDLTLNEGKFNFIIDSLIPTAYLLEISWQPQFVSREEMRKMIKDDFGDDIENNVLNKIIFINPKQDSIYDLRLDSTLNLEKLDVAVRRSDPKYNLLLQSNSKDAILLEKFDLLDRKFGIEYWHKYDSLTNINYQGNDISNNARIDEKLQTLYKDEDYYLKNIRAQKELMLENIKSPVVAYVLYSYGLSLKGIEEFAPVLSELNGLKRNDGYYRLIKNILK